MTTKLDICFLIPIDNIETFEIKPVQGQGLLKEFGWAWGHETDHARVLGVLNFNTQSM